MGEQDVLVCAGLVRRFGDRAAVDGVSLRIGHGETYGLLGPNGAGKTTCINMVCGLLTPDDGSVTVAGHSMARRDPEARARLGLVPQELALYPDLTARENLELFGRLQGLSGARLGRRLDEVLELTGLAERADERVDTYSGGMKRRANIGVGLLHQPDLLVLDEPTVGVDPQSRNAILESVESLGREGMAVLYTTHYMEEAERLCDRVGIIDDGRLVAEGTRAELVERVGEHARVSVVGTGALAAFAAQITGVDGVIEATATDGRVEVIVDEAGGSVAPVLAAAEGAGVTVTGVEVAEADLETVFLHLTGKALRD